MLTVRGLSAWYDQAQALWGINLDVSPGEVVGVLGRNGAGKTTLLNTLAGLHPGTGSVRFDGRDISALPADRRARAGLSLVREGGKLPNSLTVNQNLDLGRRLARLRGFDEPQSAATIWAVFPLLEPLRDRRAGLLSGGQRQALALAVAFASRPKLLLLDEPSAGLAPPVAHDLFAAIRRLASSGITVIAVEQQSTWLKDLVGRSWILEIGRILSATRAENRTHSRFEAEGRQGGSGT